MADLEFVRRCISGEKEAWDEFIRRYSRLIYNYANSVLKSKGEGFFTKDHLDDIFQDIFVLLTKEDFRKLKTYRGKNGCSLASWLRQVVINYTIDYLRKFKPAISIDNRQEEEGLSLHNILSANYSGARDQLLSKDKLNILIECINILENEDKFLIELYLNQGLSLELIKDKLKISRSALDMRKSRIIERLKDCFKRKGFELES